MKDGLLLLDENGWAVANLYSYCELLKWLLVEYLGISYDEASRSIESHSDYFENFNVFDVLYEVHSKWPFYYAAMDLNFGDEICQAKTVIPPPDTPEGIRLYCEIEKREPRTALSHLPVRSGQNAPHWGASTVSNGHQRRGSIFAQDKGGWSVKAFLTRLGGRELGYIQLSQDFLLPL